jgi:nucleoid-associated protein YgaU
MPNDAKLGLIVGVGLVITVAVVFFHKDVSMGHAVADHVTAANYAVEAKNGAQTAGLSRAGLVQTTSRPAENQEVVRHTVAEGETLDSLAERYYGKADRLADILQANRDRIKNLDQVSPGTVLVIPRPVKDSHEPKQP